MDRLISAPESLAQSVLVALCDDSRIQTRALRYLEELERYAAATTTTPSSSKRTKRDERLNGGVTRANPRKRKAAAAAAAATTVEPAQICLQCKRAFTPSGNSAEACLYHHGELVRDGTHSVWEGRDEVTSSPRPCDSLESREEFPDAFVWTCCDRDGTQIGCTKGYHVAIRKNPLKRLRPGDSPSGEYGVDRMFEGRALKPNEFVNESLWTGDWDEYGSRPSMGGWGTTTYAISENTQPNDTSEEQDNGSNKA